MWKRSFNNLIDMFINTATIRLVILTSSCSYITTNYYIYGAQLYNLSNVLQLLFDDAIVIVGTTRPKNAHLYYLLLYNDSFSSFNFKIFSDLEEWEIIR